MNEKDIYEYALDRLAAGADAERVIQELADAHIDATTVRDIVGTASADLIRRDYYEVLGVPRTASTQEIRIAYRQRALQYHPDRNVNPGAAERFKQINAIYDALMDPQKRAEYDLILPRTSNRREPSQRGTEEHLDQEVREDQKPLTRDEIVELVAEGIEAGLEFEEISQELVDRGLSSSDARLSITDSIYYGIELKVRSSSDFRKLAALSIFETGDIILSLVNHGFSLTLAEEYINQILYMIRKDSKMRELICAEYLHIEDFSGDLFQGLIDLGISRSDARSSISNAESVIVQRNAESRARWAAIILFAVLGFVALIIYFVSQ